MSELARKDCIPCRGGVPPLGAGEIEALLAQIDPAWRVLERSSEKFGTIQLLQRDYACEDFAQALRLAAAIGEMAEAQQHHPDLHVRWGNLGVEIWTHKIGGLTESDFVFAAKCDAIAADHE